MMRLPNNGIVIFGFVVVLSACGAGDQAASVEPNGGQGESSPEAEFRKAVGKGDLQRVSRLLKQNAKLAGMADDDGNGPLHVAVERGHLDVVALLLASDAQVDATNKLGRTPLHLACTGRAAAGSVPLLLAGGADVNVKDKQGKTPVKLAVENNLVGVASRLMTKTKQTELYTDNGGTLLHWAVENDLPEAVDALLQHKADPDAKDENGETPLHVAAWEGRDRIVSLLLAAGADAEAQDASGRTALYGAAWNGHAGAARLLLAKGAGGDSDDRQSGPIHAAAWQGHDHIIALLLAHGADPNVGDSDSATPLHKAAWQGHFLVAELLVAYDADKLAKDASGQTALDLARSKFAEDNRHAPSKRKRRNFGPEQVIGQPDTPNAGDIPTAWASKTADGQDEWLEVEFEDAVQPAGVEIHETYNPGAVNRITLFTRKGRELEVWKGKDPTAVGSGKGVSKINFSTTEKTRRIRVYIDSRKVPGWNEIDAVALVGPDAKKQWAIDARASTTYATGEIPVSGHERIIRLLQPAE